MEKAKFDELVETYSEQLIDRAQIERIIKERTEIAVLTPEETAEYSIKLLNAVILIGKTETKFQEFNKLLEARNEVLKIYKSKREQEKRREMNETLATNRTTCAS